jgi:nucleoside-diphosphate-sugar epimerase
METEKRILVIGACGQIGTELTLALRKQYGAAAVLASDLKSESDLLKGTGPFLPLDIMDKGTLQVQVRRNGINTVYLLAAMLSAAGEQYPLRAWQLNIQSLLNTLEVAREENIRQLFWPSSIAVFGPDAPKENCPQHTVLSPTTVYGISKVSGEQWCQYYHQRFGIDIRSLRYPGLIGYKALPGGGTTDYAISIFHSAVQNEPYQCFLKKDAKLPMMFMDDALRATIELMEAAPEKITVRTSYNIAAMSFTPEKLTAEISRMVPGFYTDYRPDYRQEIAESWPFSIDDAPARNDWGWKPQYEIREMTAAMLAHVQPEIPVISKR